MAKRFDETLSELYLGKGALSPRTEIFGKAYDEKRANGEPCDREQVSLC